MFFLFAHFVGCIAMALYIFSYQIRNNRSMIVCRMLGDLIYMVHYLMLGSYSGCVTLIVCALSGLVYSCKGHSWAEWRGWKWFFCGLLIVSCLFVWRTDFDPLPCICTLISILTVILTTWSGKSTINRLGKLLSAGPAWLIYCISVGSPSGAIAELIGMGSAALGLYRYGLKEQPDPS